MQNASVLVHAKPAAPPITSSTATNSPSTPRPITSFQLRRTPATISCLLSMLTPLKRRSGWRLELQRDRIQRTRFLISASSVLLTALCFSSLPSIFTIGSDVMCLKTSASASGLPLSLVAVSWNEGPSFFLSTAWHLPHSLFFSSACAAASSTSAASATPRQPPHATAAANRPCLKVMPITTPWLFLVEPVVANR